MLTRRGGRIWSALRSRRHAVTGAGVITKRPVFQALDRWEAAQEKGAQAGDQSIWSSGGAAHGGVGAGSGFGARAAHRISERGSAAGERAAGSDAAVPASRTPQGFTMKPNVRGAGEGERLDFKEIVS